jgi:Malectin-like domain
MFQLTLLLFRKETLNNICVGFFFTGFISIDCGLDANSSYVDSNTKLTYVSDDQFIDTGMIYNIAPQYATNSLSKQILNVRSFPNGIRNCYTLSSLTKGSKYLVRGTFMYGNYDKLNKPPSFDVYLGVNYWKTINITTMDDILSAEIVTTATSDYLQVCLINMDRGTPFISELDLRPLGTSTYKFANYTQSLVSFERLNIGASNQLR